MNYRFSLHFQSSLFIIKCRDLALNHLQTVGKSCDPFKHNAWGLHFCITFTFLSTYYINMRDRQFINSYSKYRLLT